jgi:nitroreductase
MDFRELVLKDRSYRRFKEDEAIPRERLVEWVDLARQCPCGGNQQALKYILVPDKPSCEKVFPSLKWAGALKDWVGPDEGERPAAYILVLLDKEIRKAPGCDQGIAAHTILLAATEAGYGGCMLGAIDRDALRATLNVPERFDILLVLALGRPSERIVLEPIGPEGKIDYYRDAEDVHHVPKRSLDEVIVEF